MRKSLKFLALAAVLPLALLGNTSPAQAAPVAGLVIAGAGTIDPPLTVQPNGGSTFTFSGTVSPGTGQVLTVGTGNDIIGSIALGEGGFTLTSPGSATGTFVRVGAVVVAAVPLQGAATIGAGVFAFKPDQVGLSVSSYTLYGGVVGNV